MKVTDFDYALPKERIAQHPVEPRDHSRLLVVDKTTGEMEHRHFYNLPEYLKPGDLLVFNDTRVIPARLYGFKDTGAHVEVFLLTRLNNTDWEVLVRPGKKLQVGAHINFSDELSGTIIDHTDFGGRIIRFAFEECSKKSWTGWVKCRCHRILRKNWKTRNGIRQFITGIRGLLRRLLQACILQKNFCRKSKTWAVKKCLSL